MKTTTQNKNIETYISACQVFMTWSCQSQESYEIAENNESTIAHMMQVVEGVAYNISLVCRLDCKRQALPS